MIVASCCRSTRAQHTHQHWYGWRKCTRYNFWLSFRDTITLRLSFYNIMTNGANYTCCMVSIDDSDSDDDDFISRDAIKRNVQSLLDAKTKKKKNTKKRHWWLCSADTHTYTGTHVLAHWGCYCTLLGVLYVLLLCYFPFSSVKCVKRDCVRYPNQAYTHTLTCCSCLFMQSRNK
jgi:hypothetical protein